MGGSKSVRSGQSGHPDVCPGSDSFRTKITAATKAQYSFMTQICYR